MLPTVTPAIAFALVIATSAPGIAAHCRLWWGYSHRRHGGGRRAGGGESPPGGGGGGGGNGGGGGGDDGRGRGGHVRDEATSETTATATTTLVVARHRHLLRLVAHVTLCAFMFGWHVHEKAALTVTVPLALALALEAPSVARGCASSATSDAISSAAASSFAFASGEYLFLSTVAHYAITPLLFQPREWPLKILSVVLGTAVSRGALLRACPTDDYPTDECPTDNDATDQPEQRGRPRHTEPQPRPPRPRPRRRLLGRLQWCYLAVGLPCVELYAVVGHSALFRPGRMEFLPLMMTSAYCAAGVAWTWGVQTAGYLGWDVSGAYLGTCALTTVPGGQVRVITVPG